MDQKAEQKTRGQRAWPAGWTVLSALLLLAFAVFLSFPLDKLQTAPWLSALQATWRSGMARGGPYGLVALIGAIIGLAEITATFPHYPREALGTVWARVLVLVNAVAALLAFVLVEAYTTPATTNRLLLALGVGLGLPALIRTRFTIARQIGGEGEGNEVSVNLGWLYDQFQVLCKTQIDLDLMKGRRSAVNRLLARFPSLQELHGLAAYTIEARETLAPKEEQTRNRQLETLASQQAPTDIARARIALFILETGGQAYVDYLLEQMQETGPPASGAAPPPAGPQLTAAESLVKQLVETLSLADLVALATRLISNPDLLGWMTQTAAPAPGVTEAQQKSAIAYRLVQEAGAEAVQRALESGKG